MILGCLPRRIQNCSICQVSMSLFQAAVSSHHANSNCGPRRRSGSSAEKNCTCAPFSHVSVRLVGDHSGNPIFLPAYVLSPFQHTDRKPDSPLTITRSISELVEATAAIRLTPRLTLSLTHSTPDLVLPNPRPALINQVFQSPSVGSSWLSLAQNIQSCFSSSVFCGPSCSKMSLTLL